jgi:hypothetical protein
MALFPEMFDEDSLLHRHGYGKPTEDVSELFSSSDFISEEDWPLECHMALATTRDLYHSIRVEMQSASKISILKTYFPPSIKDRQESVIFGIIQIKFVRYAVFVEVLGTGANRRKNHRPVCFVSFLLLIFLQSFVPSTPIASLQMDRYA